MRRLYLAAPILAALAAVAPAAPASADSYNDAVTGISVATPDDFTISRSVRENYDLVLNIDPVGSFPSRVEGQTRFCGLYFRAVPSQETQQWLNSRWKDAGVLAQARRLVDRVMEVKSEEPFSLGDVVGLEFVGPSRQDPAGVFMMSLANTPRGQLQMTCLLRSDQAAKAVWTLRSIRDTIKPPR